MDLHHLGEPLRHLRNYEEGFASQREEVNKVLTGVCEQTQGFELDKESVRRLGQKDVKTNWTIFSSENNITMDKRCHYLIS